MLTLQQNGDSVTGTWDQAQCGVGLIDYQGAVDGRTVGDSVNLLLQLAAGSFAGRLDASRDTLRGTLSTATVHSTTLVFVRQR